MHPTMRYLFSAGIICVIMSAWYFFIYRTVDKRLQLHTQRLQTMHDQIQCMRVAAEQKECLNASCTQLQTQANLTEAKDIHTSYVLTVLEYVKTLSMQLISYTVDQAHIQNACTLYTIHMTITGTISQLRSLIQKLETLSIPVSLSRCSCTYAHNDVFNITMDITNTLYNTPATKEKTLQLK